MKQQFLKAKSDTIRLTVYQDNRPIVPTSANITLYDPAGSVIQAQTTVSIDSNTGEMTYALTATHTASHKLNYKAVWDYTYDTVTYYQTQLFDVVKSILSIPITDDDLYEELESLRDQYAQEQGTATGGASGTLIDTANRKESDDFWKGGILKIISGTGEGQERDITSFTQSTSTFTVSPAWTTTPDTTSIYVVVRSYTKKIQAAFDEIENMIYNKGQRHSLILESSQIKWSLIYLTISKICRDLADQVDDKWDRYAGMYKDMFENTFSSMKVDYDEDESGSIDESEKQRSINVMTLGRA